MDDTANLVTAINCSVGRPLGDPDLDRADVLGLDRIELWWPWDTPEPTDAQVDDLVDELSRRNLTLTALNFWGGDTSAGERGVLHDRALSQRHLDAHARLAGKTGADMFNLLVGRGGRAATGAQRDRVADVAASVRDRGLGTVLVEPSMSPGEGPADYPVQTFDDAYEIIVTTPGTGLLADFWHLNETEGAEGILHWLDAITDSGQLPSHVQIADDPDRGAPGSGWLPLGDWVGPLREAGYTGDVAGEWVW
ncbi:MAG: TIM barrel protein [Mycobacteriaceae bacterium]|uniref:TIM barrel protein n=1 Tax=Corynebacterium sp. TaxID=1720 RepID=UPI003F9A8C14